MRNIQTKPIPVITRAPGTISPFTRKYPYNTPVKHDTKELQNTAAMGPEHILLKYECYSTRRSS